MSRNKPTTLFLVILSLAYAVLFYEAEMGINLLLFDGLLIVAALRCRPDLAQYKSFIWAVGGMLFAAGCVVLIHGEAALWAHHLSYLVVLGFAQARELRFIWYGLLLGGITIFRGPMQWLRVQAIKMDEKRDGQPANPTWRWVRQGLPALLILIPFLVFYLSGNQRLSTGLSGILNWVGSITLDFTFMWSLALFALGLILSVGLLFPRLGSSTMVEHQSGFDDWG